MLRFDVSVWARSPELLCAATGGKARNTVCCTPDIHGEEGSKHTRFESRRHGVTGVAEVVSNSELASRVGSHSLQYADQ